MDYLQVIVLALIQGITEFLPISSSGHLVLVPAVLGWQDQGLAFDVAVHVGTLTAVLLYFRKDLLRIISATLFTLRGGKASADSRLGWGVILATIPVGIMGFLGNDWIEANLRSAIIVALATIGFGLLLWWADARSSRTRSLTQLNWRDIAVIGLAQAVALIPGTSRSGITMTAGLMMGLDRQASARFSFLLSIPTILLAGGYQGLKLAQSSMPVDWSVLFWGAVLSALAAYACIHWFLSFLPKFGMAPFAIYRLILGLIILWVFW